MKERAEDIKHAAEYIGQQAQPKIYSTALRKLRANGPERCGQFVNLREANAAGRKEKRNLPVNKFLIFLYKTMNYTNFKFVSIEKGCLNDF